MRPTLINQPQIESLSQPLVQALRSMVAAIQTGWNKQHRGDGAHTDVEADSLVVSGLATLGKVRLGNTVRYQDLGIIGSGRIDNLTVTGLPAASVLKITTITPGINLTGIDATGWQLGELLLVINDDQITSAVDMTITAFDSNSLLANRFIGSAASGSPWTLHGSQGVLLMRDTYTLSGGTPVHGWRVISGV